MKQKLIVVTLLALLLTASYPPPQAASWYGVTKLQLPKDSI